MYGNQFLSFDFLFVIEGTDEVAATGINYTSAPGWTGAAAALAELDEDDLAAMSGGMDELLGPGGGGQWADYSQHVGVKAAAIGLDGNYLAAPLLYVDSTPSGGTIAGIPPQCSTVVSLRSGFTLGKGNYGRMYLPHHKLPYPTNEARASEAAANALAGAAAFTINAWTDIIDAVVTATVFPAIMSQAAGTLSRGVTEVGVGRVTDTQRRRRNRLEEDTVIIALA